MLLGAASGRQIGNPVLHQQVLDSLQHPTGNFTVPLDIVGNKLRVRMWGAGGSSSGGSGAQSGASGGNLLEFYYNGTPGQVIAYSLISDAVWADWTAKAAAGTSVIGTQGTLIKSDTGKPGGASNSNGTSNGAGALGGTSNGGSSGGGGGGASGVDSDGWGGSGGFGAYGDGTSRARGGAGDTPGGGAGGSGNTGGLESGSNRGGYPLIIVEWVAST